MNASANKPLSTIEALRAQVEAKKSGLAMKAIEARKRPCKGAHGRPCPHLAMLDPGMDRCISCSTEARKKMCAGDCGELFLPSKYSYEYCGLCLRAREEKKLAEETERQALMRELHSLEYLEQHGVPCENPRKVCTNMHIKSPDYKGDHSLCHSCQDELRAMMWDCANCGANHFVGFSYQGSSSLCKKCRKAAHDERAALEREQRFANQALEAEGVRLKPKVLSPLSASRSDEARRRQAKANDGRKKRQLDEVERLRGVRPVGSNNGSGDPKSGWKKDKKK
ncbi:MAG: hypothetical protein U0487_01445 [Patescibacteria group bacterium]